MPRPFARASAGCRDGRAKLVGENVRRRRQARGLTQEALAHEAGVALRLLKGIERGQRNPTVEMVGKIAAALGVHPGELFDDVQEREQHLARARQFTSPSWRRSAASTSSLAGYARVRRTTSGQSP